MKYKIVRYDGKEGKVRDFDRIGGASTNLDNARVDDASSSANLSVFFQRQLEYIESELNFVEYGELKSWKHIPVESKGGDNLWYTWRLFDKVGKWKFASDDADDVPEVNIMGAELPVPIRMFTGGFKYNVRELLAGKQAAENHPNQPSLQIESQKAIAVFEAYQQFIDIMCWFADPTNPEYVGLTGVFYNPYISTVAAAAGASHTYWFNSAGVLQKTPLEVLKDLNAMCTTVRNNTKDRYAIDTILMPIWHFNMLTTTPMSETYPMETIMRFFLRNHPEITTVDTLVAAESVPAGGNLASATDVILGYKKDPSVVKIEISRQFTTLPIQERGFNYIVPCWATTAGVITKKPKAMVMLTGTSLAHVGS